MVQALREHFGYIPEVALEELSILTGLPQARLFGMISFYDGFGFQSVVNDHTTHPECSASYSHADPRGDVADPSLLRELLLGKLDTRKLYQILRQLRNEIIEGVVVNISHTSCACASGSEALHEAVMAWQEGRKTKLYIRDTGCYGWCSRQPVMEVQLPGKSKLIFSGLRPEDVPEILDMVHSGNISSRCLLGQSSIPQAEDWENIRHIDRMGWMRSQKRVITALSGRIDPGSIAEYIAHGGYSSFVKRITGYTNRHVCE
ncbi:MAG: hypothetical protein IH599_01405, partial [Bacteroidales bacterium]|nr:hypothetical protein [Bacteroidales bacterium]